MHRDVLTACLPALATLALLSAGLIITARLSGARLRLSRIADLHRCEQGGVQSLAFVITLPIFLMIVLLIVQVALLMIGLITVNSAAFAAARSAAVWIPAHVRTVGGDDDDREPQNRLPPGITPGTNLQLDLAAARSSPKYSEIFDAAALACVPIAPSRAVSGTDLSVLGTTTADEALITLYGRLVPSSAANSVLPQRLRNKLAYSLQNTRVVLRFEDRNSGIGPGSELGPTYNPPTDALPNWVHVPHEVGWQDPVTVEVWHQFALLPGPGRFLARALTRYDGRTDDVAPMIDKTSGVHKTWLTASATLTIEGIKSVYPCVQGQ